MANGSIHIAEVVSCSTQHDFVSDTQVVQQGDEGCGAALGQMWHKHALACSPHCSVHGADAGLFMP